MDFITMLEKCTALAEDFEMRKRSNRGFSRGATLEWRGTIGGRVYADCQQVTLTEVERANFDVLALREHTFLESALRILMKAQEENFSSEELRLRALERQLAEQARRISELEAKVD